mgnify:CR=1 FL=1
MILDYPKELQQIVYNSPGNLRIWNPHELRIETPDENGNDLAFRYLAVGNGYRASFRVPCLGVKTLHFFVMFSGSNATPTVSFIGRVYPNNFDNNYGSIDIRAVGATMTANNSRVYTFATDTAQDSTMNGVIPVMFQFLFRADSTATTTIVPVTVWVVGRY